MDKGPQGWVKCEDRLPYYKDNSCGLPGPHDHDPATREDLGPGVQGPLEWGSWGSWGFNAAREGAVPGSFV
jgi:hypothetical protein